MSKPQRYAGGTIQRTAAGTYKATLHHHGDRDRVTFKTLEAARDWLAQATAEARLSIPPATPAEIADAAEARRLLEGRATLTEAARTWISGAGTLTPIRVSDAVTAYLEARSGDNLRPRSLEAWHHRLGVLSRAYGDRLIHEVSTADLQQIQTGATATRNNLRRYWITFFCWCILRGHAAANPAEALTLATGNEPLPQALTVDQVRALLSAAVTIDPGIVPYVAVGLFAGLRAAELDRLAAAHIRDGRLHLDPTVTKLRDRRVLDLLCPLPAWLEAFPPAGPLRLVNHRKRLDAVKSAAGLAQAWPQNALRHSFATYHLAAFRDPGRTAHYTRHANQATLYRHYVDIATHADGIAYFALTPDEISTTANWA